MKIGRLAIYLEPRDMWIGLFWGVNAVYVCPFPCVAVRWERKK